MSFRNSLSVFVLTGLFTSGAGDVFADDVEFDRDIRPLLSNTCYTCHGPDQKTREAELRLDLESGAFAQRDTPTIVRGKPAASELYRRITSDDPDLRMPPPDAKKQLTDQQIATIGKWIEQGADWDGHWAFLKPQRPDVPKVEQKDFTRNPLDHFILQRLQQENLTPSEEADRVTLARRLYFDLIGLPPTPAEVDAFVQDRRPDAYEQLVDRLLKSEHFGERMAIYWLDVVRYADSNGYHSDEPRSVAPYRDYVIESFNKNKPFDQFTIEQLAGDLLPSAGVEQKVASGFNMLLQTTNEGGAQEKEYLAKYAADRVRNTSSIFLGITMGCCECHDHKYDPFTMADFYNMEAFFADIQERGRGNPPAYPVATAAHRQQLDLVDQEIAAVRSRLNQSTPALEKAQREWEASLGSIQPDVTPSVWHSLGPFKAASFDEAHEKEFISPQAVDLKKVYGGLKWTSQPKYVDGKVHPLQGDNSAVYLFRIIEAPAATTLKVSLGSDDSVQLWLNGRQQVNEKVQRAVAPDQNATTLNLTAGKNELLLKIANGSGGFGFYFRAQQSALPANVVNVLKIEAAQRTPPQQRVVSDYYRTIAPSLAPLRKDIADLEARKKQIQQSQPKTLMTVATTPRTIRLLPRGNWLDESGPVTQPAVPEFLGRVDLARANSTGDDEDRRANRLDLAQWIVDRDNPLAARTFVNRLWKLYFGRGLAEPLDDLGAQGRRPSHPELLDWLAVEFMDSGWNVKRMVRLLVTSGSYRQSSLASPELRTTDPYNELYARQSRFRLDAELVRDNALAVSGLLVTSIGGPSLKPYQPAGYWRHMNFPRRTWQQDAGERLYRRGLYTWWQRMFLHPSLLAFDAPSREECTVERARSNTPQQALVLLNDPTYVEAARSFATRIASNGTDFDSCLEWAFRQAVSRPPTAREAKVLLGVWERHFKAYKQDARAASQLLSVGASPASGSASPASGSASPAASGNTAELAAWTSVARIILNLHETITRS